jgi:hypothetical protein
MLFVNPFGNGSATGNVKSKSFGVYRNGYLLNTREHMHNGGSAVTLFLSDKEICASKASHGGVGGSVMVKGKEWKTINKMKIVWNRFR